MKRSRILRNIGLGIKSLLLHKMRSILTMLGVVFGVGSVVAMLSVGAGAKEQAIAQIAKLGARNIILDSVKPPDDKNNTRRTYVSMYGLKYEDEERIRETYPAVVCTAPAKIFTREARLGERSSEVRVVGTTPEWFTMVPSAVLAGRAMADHDMDDPDGVVVLSEAAARQLLAGRHSIGQSIRIGGEYFTVVGIVQSESGDSGGDVQAPNRPFDAYIPINVCRDRFGEIITTASAGAFQREQVEINQLLVQIDDTSNVEKTANAIAAMLKRFHKYQDYTIQVPLQLLRQAEETQRIFNIVLGSIAGISLLVGGIGIMNIMLASVTERTREIGIRRAIGAKRTQIIGQFLIECIVLSLTGGIIGVGLGLAIPEVIERFANMPTRVTLDSVILSLAISAAVGIIFGLYPAYRAAKLDPIVALRHTS